jgi:outer membrane protein OmpA-like peptidoglycan-associated protein
MKLNTVLTTIAAAARRAICVPRALVLRRAACKRFPRGPFWLLSSLLCVPVALGAGSDRLGSYDFSYEVTGDQRVRPVQVFDDGHATYFQFRSGESIPAIFAEAPTGAALVVPQLEGPYVKIASLSGAYALRLGYGAGRVSYTGTARAGAVAAASTKMGSSPSVAATTARLLATNQLVSGLPREMFQDASPRASLEENSYATPLRGDLVEWTEHSDAFKDHAITFALGGTKLNGKIAKFVKAFASAAAAASRVEVLGRDDPSHKEGIAEARAATIASALVAAGVPRNVISTKTTVEVKDEAKTSVQGVTVRIYERAPKAPVSPDRGASDAQMAAILKGIRGGTITPAQAVALIEQSRAAAVETSPAKAPAVPANPTTWAIRAADESVQKMLERWASLAGWKVVWRGAPAIRITGDSEISKLDFLQAADMVISQSKSAGYRIQARAFSNQVLLVEGSTQ